LVQFGLCFVLAVKIEVILSFLGLGVPPGTPSWGLMIDDGKQEIANGFWWNVLAGSGFMFGLVLSVNLLIEFLREHSDFLTSSK
jgi:peptide/nickel transport system permease protein